SARATLVMMASTQDGWTLHEAAYQGRSDLVGQLLAAGADPDAPAPEGGRRWISAAGPRPRPLNCVAIAWALGPGHVAVARLLLEHDAHVDETVLRDFNVESAGAVHDLELL